MFECPKIPGKLKLSEASCANYHLSAQKREWAYRLPHCVECPVGARNAGIDLGAPFQRRALCLRCGSAIGRQVFGRLCMSCYNRETEWRKGRNAKGGVPRDYRALVGFVFVSESSGRRYFIEVATVIEARLVAQKVWGLVDLILDNRASVLKQQMTIFLDTRITHAKAPCRGEKVDRLMVGWQQSPTERRERDSCTV